MKTITGAVLHDGVVYVFTSDGDVWRVRMGDLMPEIDEPHLAEIPLEVTREYRKQPGGCQCRSAPRR